MAPAFGVSLDASALSVRTGAAVEPIRRIRTISEGQINRM
jgi:hypothetical protein